MTATVSPDEPIGLLVRNCDRSYAFRTAHNRLEDAFTAAMTNTYPSHRRSRYNWSRYTFEQRLMHNFGLTSFKPSSLPKLLVPRSGGNAASCHPALQICTCSACTFKARALLLLLRLSSKCFALDFLTGAAGSSSGSLCTSHRDGDLNRRRGLVGEVTGEVSLWTRVPNMVIIRPGFTPREPRIRCLTRTLSRGRRWHRCTRSSHVTGETIHRWFARRTERHFERNRSCDRCVSQRGLMRDEKLAGFDWDRERTKTSEIGHWISDRCVG